MSTEDSILFNDLVDYGLEHLLPQHLTTDDGEEGFGHQFGQQYSLDPIEDRYYDNYFDGDADDAWDYEDEDVEVVEDDDDVWLEEDSTTSIDNTVANWNVDSLMRAFDCDFMDYSEFLNSHLWTLFGVPKRQLDLIDWRYITEDNFSSFHSAFTGPLRDQSIERRIKYATVSALTDYSRLYIPEELTRQEYLQYAHHIIDCHSPEECQDIFQKLTDYFRFYQDGVEMDERRAQLGEQTFNYTLTPKVAHLADLHDKAFRDHQVLETERMGENSDYLDQMIKGVSKSIDYKHYLYAADGYIVKAATSQGDLIEEGHKLNHCVASYGSYMARGKSYIYFIRRASEPDKPFFTAEILPPSHANQSAKLNQCYTYNDTTTKTPELQSFIHKWAKVKKFKIACKI